jgi:predicted DNA-binding protein
MMGVYTKRVQTVLTDRQYDELMQIANQQGKTISELVREAVEETYLKTVALERQKKALDQLLALDAPVADWEQMEAEIIRGALGES